MVAVRMAGKTLFCFTKINLFFVIKSYDDCTFNIAQHVGCQFCCALFSYYYSGKGLYQGLPAEYEGEKKCKVEHYNL